MVRRKQLRNLACGIAGRFASRNNDVDGYWALGLLYSAADAAGVDAISLDILSKVATPSFAHAAKLLTVFDQYISERLEDMGLTGCVFTATVDIEFNAEPPPLASFGRNTWGDPYLGRVALTDDTGLTRSASFRGWCGKHDPRREHRSNRAHSG